MDVRAGIDAKGNLVAFDFTQFYPQYKDGNIRTVNELVGTPVAPSETSGQFWPATMYSIPNNRYLLKQLPPEGNWIKTAWFRAGSALHTTFAAEQVIDDLARAAKLDPVAFRAQNVAQGPTREPLLALLNAVTKAANWQPKITASKLSDADVVNGRGVAWSNVYGANNPSAAVADITVNKKTGKITIKHVYQAFSAGLSVYPGGVDNQAVGGIIQALSRGMVEQLRFNTTRQTSLDFVSYPILRFKDSPKLTTILLQRTDLPPQGVGEPVAVTAPAAVANAFFDATGVRMQTAPMTPPRVRAVLKAAGVV
jgi:CO/xanthine dehydrogenase Mo-binding subunit